jgi:hypothetical protein
VALAETPFFKLGHCENQIRRTKSVYGNARQRYAVNRPGRTSPNVFKKSNKINLLGFEHLVDIEGVTGSIPVAPTIQSSRTAETVLDRKEAVSAGICSPIFNVPGLCRQ